MKRKRQVLSREVKLSGRKRKRKQKHTEDAAATSSPLRFSDEQPSTSGVQTQQSPPQVEEPVIPRSRERRRMPVVTLPDMVYQDASNLHIPEIYKLYMAFCEAYKAAGQAMHATRDAFCQLYNVPLSRLARAITIEFRKKIRQAAPPQGELEQLTLHKIWATKSAEIYQAERARRKAKAKALKGKMSRREIATALRISRETLYAMLTEDIKAKADERASTSGESSTQKKQKVKTEKQEKPISTEVVITQPVTPEPEHLPSFDSSDSD